jgi:hypothetical protein
MDLVKKLVGSILAFVGGFFGFLTGLLGFKKSEYFMELEDGNEEKSVATALPKKANFPAPTTPKAIEPVPATEPVTVKAAKPSRTTPFAKSAKAPQLERAKQPAPQPVTKVVQPTETNFATRYLMPIASQSDRRRPGPSLNPFIDMAKQVKS